MKKVARRNFTKFTGKQLRPATLLKKGLAQMFSCKFYEISKNIFFHRTASGRLLLNISANYYKY